MEKAGNTVMVGRAFAEAAQAEVDRLKKEMDSLKAQNERLRSALCSLYSDCVNLDAVGVVDGDAFIDAGYTLDETPAQSLAAIKAEAVREASEECYSSDGMEFFEWLEEHADKLEKGE